MSFMDPKSTQTSLTKALPRNNIREWAVVVDQGVIHKASCRRCGAQIESVNNLGPVISFREEHRECTGGDVTY